MTPLSPSSKYSLQLLFIEKDQAIFRFTASPYKFHNFSLKFKDGPIKDNVYIDSLVPIKSDIVEVVLNNLHLWIFLRSCEKCRRRRMRHWPWSRLSEKRLDFCLWKESEGKFLDEGDKAATADIGTDLWDKNSMIFTTGSFKLNFVGFLRHSDAGGVRRMSQLDYLN